MSRAAEARIDLDAVSHNLHVLRQLAPKSKILAVIKANAYGHGMTNMARALEGTDAYGVACVSEARILRSHGIATRLLLLAGFYNQEELQACAELNLNVVVHQVTQVTALESSKLDKPLHVWLKIDSGMHRLGIAPSQFDECYARLNASRNVEQITLMTHFARADEPHLPETQQQIDLFDKTIAGVDAPCSLANSAGIIKFPHAQRDWVRPGIMLYGVAPFADQTGLDYGLKPVMTFTSKLVNIRHCKRGDAIGYGGAYVCPQDMPIGIVAVGYGDGYPRHGREGTPVLVNGQRVPLVGRVSMDSLFVDLRDCAPLSIGDEAVLWGYGLPVEEIALCANTIPYELLCKVTARPRFVYSK